MTFLWPAMLLLLLLLPAVAMAYLGIERRRRRRLAGLGMLRLTGVRGTADRPGSHGLRRYLPASLVLAGLVLLVVALARPQAVIAVPREQGTVVLAFDVSGSMAAEDLTPNRLAAAKVAATAFVERQPASVLIGVVAFSDSGLSVQVPTNEQDEVIAAIRRLDPQRGTSLARGIAASLATIAAAEGEDDQGYYSDRSPAPSQVPAAVPPGSHGSAVIVLLSDGENTVEPDPIEAAQAAADLGVAIHTIGIGSPGGITLELEGFSVHTALDEEMLQQIGTMTAGTYQRADSTESLTAIYDSIDTRVISRDETTELTAIVVGASLVLLTLGAVVSLAWLGRLP
jgi:Ca-activated chloride channel family protein